MTPRQKLAEAVRPFAPDNRLRPEHIPPFDALADALGLPRDTDGEPKPAAAPDEGDAIILDHLRKEEGVRARAYRDHLGYWTTGVGRLIDPRRGGRITPSEEAKLIANDPSRKPGDWRNWVLTDAEIDLLLSNDIAVVRKQLAERDDLAPAWRAVQGFAYREAALISMAFQMGAVGLGKFRNTLALVASRQFERAGRNMLKSLWAKQTPDRARRVAHMMARNAPGR